MAVQEVQFLMILALYISCIQYANFTAERKSKTKCILNHCSLDFLLLLFLLGGFTKATAGRKI